MKNNKRIMILGASDLQVPLITKAKERGLFVIVVSPSKDEPGKRFADITIECDVRDELFLLEKAKELKIDGIITDQTDIAVRTVAFVSEKMGLPGIGYETAKLFTDKYLMRERCKEIGVPTLRYILTNELEDALRFYNSIGSDLILKPVDSQGSRGVSLINSKQKLVEKFKEAIGYSRSGKVLLEQFVSGREFVVEGIALNYKFENAVIGDTYYFDIPDVFSATQRVFPTNADEALKQKVLSINKCIVEGFGLKQGITHSEFIMNGDDVILIETAARGGGVFISSDLISLSTGMCSEDFLIDICLGICDELPHLDVNKCSCCYLAFYLPEGVVEECKCIDSVLSLPFTFRNNLKNIKTGLKTRPIHDKTARFNIILSGCDRNELNKNVEYVKKVLDGIRVRTKEGDLRTPIWK